MLFATAQHRVCRGGICWNAPSRLQGLGDAIDSNDPCASNPSDPVCIQFYGGLSPAEQAAMSSHPATVGGLCATDAECADGFTCNAATGACEPITSSSTGSSVASWWSGSILNPSTWGNSASNAAKAAGSARGSAASAAAAADMSKVPWGFMLVVALVGGAAYGGIRWYEKKRKR